jgi:hypothetical protein
MVGLGRFELPTSHLSGARSNQLSYRPARLEPGISRCTTLGLSKPNSTRTMSSNSSLAGRPPIERVTGKPGFRRHSLNSREGTGSPMFTKVGSARLLTIASDRSKQSSKLPRKEVIQPQVPLRLPCYDFTPITSQTLDGSLPCGLGRRLLVQPAFVV